MRYMKSIFATMFCLFVFTACNGGGDMNNNMTGDTLGTGQEMMGQDTTDQGMMGDQSIAAAAQNNPNLSTLVKALKSAGLVNMLSTMEGGPYTVFAPTNEAFNALPEGTLDNLMNNQQELTSILQYHVVEGTIMASDIQDGQMVASVEGTDLEFTVSENGTVTVNGAEVQQTIRASNGVIHVIGKVLMPSQ